MTQIKQKTLAELLFEEPYLFDFYQAVRILEKLSPEKIPVGESPEPNKEPVRFSSRVSWDFPASEISKIDCSFKLTKQALEALDKNGVPESIISKIKKHFGHHEYKDRDIFLKTLSAEIGEEIVKKYKSVFLKCAQWHRKMEVNFIGLAGVNGPLPRFYTEKILDQARKTGPKKDTAFKDFLDMFNHRLTSLMYQVAKTQRITFDFYEFLSWEYDESNNSRKQEKGRFPRCLFSLIGLGTENLRRRMKINDRALLFYAGILAQKPRSMKGLEVILTDYFHLKDGDCKSRVKIKPFVGRWYDLEDDQVTKLGTQNFTLGQDTIAGDKVWDQQAKFEIHLGPLTLDQLLDFLPPKAGGTAFTPLCQLTRFYVGTEFDFDIILYLDNEETVSLELGAENGPRLGWTSWGIGNSHLKREYDAIILTENNI